MLEFEAISLADTNGLAAIRGAVMTSPTKSFH